MRANLDALAKIMVPMSEDRVREVLRDVSAPPAGLDDGFVAVEAEARDDFWASAARAVRPQA